MCLRTTFTLLVSRTASRGSPAWRQVRTGGSTLRASEPALRRRVIRRIDWEIGWSGDCARPLCRGRAARRTSSTTRRLPGALGVGTMTAHRARTPATEAKTRPVDRGLRLTHRGVVAVLWPHQEMELIRDRAPSDHRLVLLTPREPERVARLRQKPAGRGRVLSVTRGSPAQRGCD